MSYCKKCLDKLKWKFITWRGWFWMLTLLFLAFIITAFLKFQGWWAYDGFFSEHVEELNYVFMVLLTFIIVLVAYVQLHSLRKTTVGDFLLEIDKRYNSKQIIEAREIIRNFFLEAKHENIKNNNDQYIVKEQISKKVRNLAERNLDENDKTDATHKYILLLGLLDLLETVAYYGNKHFVKREQIEGVLGGTMSRYYNVLKSLIEYIREDRAKYDDYKDVDGKSCVFYDQIRIFCENKNDC